MLGMGIAAVLQTYAWEGSATWLARTWDVISRLDALDAQLKGAEASAARLVGGFSQDEANRGRVILASARELTSGLPVVDRPVLTELDALTHALDSGRGQALAALSTHLAEQAHEAIRATTQRQRRMVLDRLDTEKSIVRFARALLEVTSALSFFMIALMAWQASLGSKGRASAERALADKEDQYRQVVEMAGDIICRTDREGRFTFCNQTALTMLHFTENEVVGRGWLKFVRHDKRAEARRFYLRQFARRTANTYYEFPVIDGYGRERWLGQNVQLLVEDGRPCAFQAIAREITERKRAEYELEKTRAFVERIAATTPGILYVHDLEEHRNIYSNGEAVSVLGDNPDGVLQVHPDDAGQLRIHHESLRLALEGEVRRIEYRVRHAAGHWVWLSSCDTPFERARNGQVRRIVGIAQDITARKSGDEERARQVDYDALTGIANPAHFRRLTQAMLRRAAIEQSAVCFCVIEIGRGGDGALRTAGRILREELRDQDTVGMLGDKELGFVLPQTEFAAAAAVARSICARIGESASAAPGLAEWHPQMSLDDLMDAARRTLPTACAKAS